MKPASCRRQRLDSWRSAQANRRQAASYHRSGTCGESESKRFDRLDPQRDRASQATSDGPQNPQKVWLPSGPAREDDENRPRAGRGALQGIGSLIRILI